MTEYDYCKIFPKMLKKVTIGDITVRDGFQHEEKLKEDPDQKLPNKWKAKAELPEKCRSV